MSNQQIDITQNLSKLIAKPPPLTARPLSVQLTIPVLLDPVTIAHSEVFAMRRLRDGMSLAQALARAGAKYDSDTIRSVYHKIAPGLPDDANPDPAAIRFAKDWMG